MSKIRIKDIADLAQVSIGTVDRVIHNRGEVSPATRERILRLLEEYDYSPDIAGRSLALKRVVKLGILMPESDPGHPFWSLPLNGIELALAQLSSYRIEIRQFLFNQHKKESFMETIMDFPHEELEGLLFAPVFRNESLTFMKKCREDKLPLVLFNSLLEEAPSESFVGQDAFSSGEVAGRLLHHGVGDKGTLIIVNMSARMDHYDHIRERERGFRSYFSQFPNKAYRLVSLDMNGLDLHRMEEKLSEACSDHAPDGIFVTNSRVYHVAGFLEKHRKKHTRMVGYDLLPQNQELLNKGQIDFLLSQKPEEQAYKGLQSLFKLAVFNHQPEKRQWLPIDIITKENLRYYETKNDM